MTYRLFNLTIDADIPLPLLRCSADTGHADIVFREAAVPQNLVAPLFTGSFYQVAGREFLLEVKDVARFWGQDGRLVFFERACSACDTHIILFLLGTVLGALLQQQGTFLLHASAVVRDAGAILFAGESGAGKSTLTAAMVREGYRLIADDACLLTLENGRVIVHPGHPHIRLWRDSLELLNISPEQLSRIHTDIDKYYWPVENFFEPAPQPVDAFFELTTVREGGIVTSGLTGIDKLSVLVKNTFRVEALDYVASRTECITYWAARAGYFPLFRLARSTGKRSGTSVLTAVETALTSTKEYNL